MRKYLVPMIAAMAVSLAACADDPTHHPMHYAKLYIDNQQHMYTFVDNEWWLFETSGNKWEATSRPTSYTPAAYANSSTGKSSALPGLVEVKGGKPQNEEYEGTPENTKDAMIDEAVEQGSTAVAPEEAGGGSNVSKTPEDQKEVTEPTEETPEAAPAPETEAPVEAPAEAPAAPAESSDGGSTSTDSGGGGSDAGGGGGD